MNKTSKKIVIRLITLSLVAILAATAPVMILITNPNAFIDPVVTEPTGVDADAAIVTPPDLPGTQTGSGGKIFPIGFTLGQAQFGGNGVEVSGLAAGETVKICFDFPLYRYKWTGTIRMWNGTKWVPQATTVTPGAEGTRTWACTPKAGNGIYALIIGYYGTPEPAPVEPQQEPDQVAG